MALTATFGDEFVMRDSLAALFPRGTTFADTLDSWSDAVTSKLLGHFRIAVADDINNWADALVKTSQYQLIVSDRIVIEDNLKIFGAILLAVADSIDNWSDSLATPEIQGAIKISLSDDVNNWSDNMTLVVPAGAPVTAAALLDTIRKFLKDT